MIILHNPLDKDSSDFIAAHGAGHTILEYPECIQRFPYISAFPSVVIAEQFDAHYICRQPKTWQDVEIYADSIKDKIDNYTVLSQIAQIESTITPRRQREAIIGTDNGWLANVDTQIAALRAQLK